MTGDLDSWLNDGVGDDVAKAQGQSAPAPEPVQPPVNPATKPAKPPSLKNIGIGRGGVIRNPNTKRVTLTGNTVTNPKPSKLPAKIVKEPTPEEDFKAEHPALAFPSVMTGMDLDTEKRPSNGAVEAPSQPPPAPPLSQPAQAAAHLSTPVSYESTLRQLLQLALDNGGTLHFGTAEFIVSIQITAPASRVQG